MQQRAKQLLWGRHVCVVALIAAVALLVPAAASATSPVLEFVVPGHSLPVSFTTESGLVKAEMAGFESLVDCTASSGEGEITGPRSTVSKYVLTGCTVNGGSTKCKSEDASNEEEIQVGPIDGELVYLDQARREVGVLLNPSGGIYIAFECGGIPAEGKGPFLAPVSPIDQEATSFTATLDQSNSVQTPDEYENEKGDLLQAIPTGRKGTNKFVPTGVEAAFTVHPVVPVEVKAVTTGEIEAEQREAEAAKQHEEKQHEEEALKKAEEHAKQVGEEAKKREGELNAQIAAAKKELEEAEKAKSRPPTRAQLLKEALRACEKRPKKRRPRCVANAHKRYSGKAKKTSDAYKRLSRALVGEPLSGRLDY